MSAARQTEFFNQTPALTLGEFLAWERQQPLRYEFDGVQPVAMTGGTAASDRVTRRLVIALDRRLSPPCEVFGENIKLVTADRVRYPDVKVVCGAPVDDAADNAGPTAVFEVLSSSTELTDRRVKPREYASVETVKVYAMLSQSEPVITVLRRSANWAEELVKGVDATLDLPEIGVAIPLTELYPPRA